MLIYLLSASCGVVSICFINYRYNETLQRYIIFKYENQKRKILLFFEKIVYICNLINIVF